MGIRRRNWDEVAGFVKKIRDLGLSYAKGADHFGISVDDIYEYNRFVKKKSGANRVVKNWAEIGDYVTKIEELGLSYAEGARQFGISVKDIYRYTREKREERVCVQLKKKNNDNDNDHDYAVDSSFPESNSVSTEPVLGGGGIVDIVPVESATAKPFSSADVRDVSDEDEINCNLKLPLDVVELIVNYRKQNPEHGYKRIEDHLKHRYFVSVPRKKIRKVLKLHGLVTDFDSSFDKVQLDKAKTKGKGSTRFEASYPRELYQMDITYVYLADSSVYYLVLILDDNSRFCVGHELRKDQKGVTMIEVLHRSIERYGKPQKLLSDQGRSFYTWSREQTVFQKYLDDMKIEHIVSNPHSPQTLGKVERLNQTVQRELLDKFRFNSYQQMRSKIDEYFHSYNYERPHQGIGGDCPSNRFHGIVGETRRIESELSTNTHIPCLDFSQGYLVFKNTEHTICVLFSSSGIKVLLDGKLLSVSGVSGGVNQNDENENENENDGSSQS